MGEKASCTLHRPTQRERLGQFAASHFVISALGAVFAISVGLVFFLVAAKSEQLMMVVLVLCSVIAMSTYVGAGFRSAKIYGWDRLNKFSDGFLAFLFPALIAWAWGTLILYCASRPGLDAYEIVSMLLLANIFVALPSLIMVITCLVLGLLDGGLPNMIICMLLAGGLPPLLYLLGSIWGSRKGKRYVETSNEEEE